MFFSFNNLKSDEESDEEVEEQLRQRSSTTTLTLLGRRIPRAHKIRKQSKSFKCQLRIYCALHNPVGCAKIYHLIVVFLIFMSCIVLNIFDDPITDIKPDSKYLMCGMDLILIGMTYTCFLVNKPNNTKQLS